MAEQTIKYVIKLGLLDLALFFSRAIVREVQNVDINREELHQLIDALPQEMLLMTQSFLESLLEYDIDLE